MINPPCFVGECQDTSVGVRVWRIVAPFSFHSAERQRVINVPEGFLTDFASVPRLLWSIAPPSGEYDPAACVHDFAVRNRKPLSISLYACHRIFREALLTCGTAKWKAEAMYRAVLLFNWLAPGDGWGSTPKSLLKRVRAIDLVAA